MFLEPYSKRSCRLTDVVLLAILALDLVKPPRISFLWALGLSGLPAVVNGIKRLVMCTDSLFFEGSCESFRHALHTKKRDAKIGASFLFSIFEFLCGSKGGLLHPGLVVVI